MLQILYKKSANVKIFHKASMITPNTHKKKDPAGIRSSIPLPHYPAPHNGQSVASKKDISRTCRLQLSHAVVPQQLKLVTQS